MSLNKFYVDEIYNKLFLAPFYHFSSQFASFDSVVIDGAVNGIGDNVRNIASYIRTAQTGIARFYAVTMFVGTIIILLILFFY